MLMRLMSKGEYLIVPKGTKFKGAGKLGLKMGRGLEARVAHPRPNQIWVPPPRDTGFYGHLQMLCLSVL